MGSVSESGTPPISSSEIATHSSILGWEIRWAEEPGGLPPQGHKEPDATGVTVQAHTHKLTWKCMCTLRELRQSKQVVKEDEA